MTGIELSYLILIIVCVVLSAFFCSAETAFHSIQRFKLEHMLSTGVKGAKRVTRMMQQVTQKA